MSIVSRHLRLVPTPSGAAEPEKKKHKAVVDGELIYTSVSQLQKFTPEVGGCPSKWFFRYVLGLPDDPPGKGQLRGTEGHGRIEDYLEDGIDVLDRLEREGKKYMPEPNVRPDGSRHPVPVLVEAHFGPNEKKKPFVQLNADGVPVVGYIDLIDPRDPRWLLLKDWKFKKSIADYGVKPSQLLNPKHEAGIQIIGYLEALRLAHEAGVFAQSWAIPSHVTFQTQGAVEVVETTTEDSAGNVKPIQLDSARESWETVTHAAIPGMRKAARAKSHTEVPKNTGVCHKYRKACPYLGTCQDRMARIRMGFASKTPAPQVLTEAALMGMMGVMTGGATAPIQTQSASTPPPAVTKPPAMAPGQATLTAALCQQMQDYEIKGAKYRFLTLVDMGGQKFASFSPIAGGPPQLFGLDEPVTSLAAPIVKPPDAPASNPAAHTPAPPAVDAGIIVTACAMGEKYDVDGQIGEFTGTSAAGGGVAFFQTTAGTVKLPLTAKVKPVKGAPPAAETVTAQSPSASSAPGNPAQSAEAPKGEGSPSGAEVKPEAKKPGRPRKAKIDDKSEGDPPKPEAAKPPEQPAPESRPATPAELADMGITASGAIAPQTHAVDGTAYGALAGVKLYFGCSPVGVAAQMLGAYVDGLERQILKATQSNICDLRVAQDQTLGYSKWEGLLADLCRETPPPPGHYVVMGYADKRVGIVADTLAQRIAALHPGNVVKAG